MISMHSIVKPTSLVVGLRTAMSYVDRWQNNLQTDDPCDEVSLDNISELSILETNAARWN